MFGSDILTVCCVSGAYHVTRLHDARPGSGRLRCRLSSCDRTVYTMRKARGAPGTESTAS
jgi:hypothetical protein